MKIAFEYYWIDVYVHMIVVADWNMEYILTVVFVHKVNTQKIENTRE